MLLYRRARLPAHPCAALRPAEGAGLYRRRTCPYPRADRAVDRRGVAGRDRRLDPRPDDPAIAPGRQAGEVRGGLTERKRPVAGLDPATHVFLSCAIEK